MAGRLTDLPEGLGKAVRVHDYKTLAARIEKVHVYRTIVVSGPPGRGKTELARAVLGDHAVWFGSRSTAFTIYQTISEVAGKKDVALVFDDVRLRGDPLLVGLLMQLCDTGSRRIVTWQTDTARQRDLPEEVCVENPTLILTNDLRTMRTQLALDDRVHHLHFEPTPLEVHLRAVEWFVDQEIYDYIAEQLRMGVIADCSLRMYTKAQRCKAAGDDFRQEILPYLVEERLRVTAEVNARCHSRQEKAKAYYDRTGKSAATFYRDLKALRRIASPVEVPCITLRPPQPGPREDEPARDGDVLHWLRRPPLN